MVSAGCSAHQPTFPPLFFRQAFPGVPIYVRALDMQHTAALQEAGGRGGACVCASCAVGIDTQPGLPRGGSAAASAHQPTTAIACCTPLLQARPRSFLLRPKPAWLWALLSPRGWACLAGRCPAWQMCCARWVGALWLPRGARWLHESAQRSGVQPGGRAVPSLCPAVDA